MFYHVKPLKWDLVPALFLGRKLIARDCFGNVFGEINVGNEDPITSRRISVYIHNKELEYKEKILSALKPNGKFTEGEVVYKPNGSWWAGKVVGFYSTEQTPEGYAVQLDGVKNGPIQIYPAAALAAFMDQ